MKPFNIQIIVYYVEKKGSNTAARNKTEWLRVCWRLIRVMEPPKFP